MKSKKEISIDYIRAFFDGEGCIYIGYMTSNPNHLMGRIKISNTNKEIIYLISEKLEQLKIKNYVYKRNWNKQYKTLYDIIISDVVNIERFYRIIGTFFDKKENKIRLFLENSNKLSKYKKIPKIIKLKKEGLSQKKISEIVNISAPTISRILNGQVKYSADYYRF